MIDTSTVYLIGFVSEIVFALVLSLLAWKERRMRGITWFAAASVIQFLCSALRNRLGGTASAGAEWTAAGQCITVLAFFFVYMGLRWFTLRRPLASQIGPVAISLGMTLVLVLSAFSQAAARFSSRMVCIAIMAAVIPMLLEPRVPSMRQMARFVAGLMGCFSAMLLFRSGMEAALPSLIGGVVDLWARLITIFIANALYICFIGLFLAETHRRLHEETRMDLLTGLRNRRAIEEIAVDEVKSAARQGVALSLLLIDADHFKKLNDTWGHGVGDRALRHIGEALDKCCSCVARVGGEEFAVLLPRTRIEEATEMGEELRLAVAECVLVEGNHRIPLSVSVGVSALRGGERSWLEMLRRADRALYRAKHEGRNRVAMWCEGDVERASTLDSKFSKWRRALASSTHRKTQAAAEHETTSASA